MPGAHSAKISYTDRGKPYRVHLNLGTVARPVWALMAFDPVTKTFDQAHPLTQELRAYEAEHGAINLSDRAPESIPDPPPVVDPIAQLWAEKQALESQVINHTQARSPHNTQAIDLPYQPVANSPIGAGNLQIAMDQLTMLHGQQQQQIDALFATRKPALVDDPFISVNGTRLTSHTPKSYITKWQEVRGAWTLLDYSTKSDATTGSAAVIDASIGKNLVIEAEIVFADSTALQGLMFNYNPLTGYHWRVVWSKSGGKFDLQEVGASTLIRRSFITPITLGVPYGLRIVRTDNISVYLNGQLMFEHASTVNEVNTRHGLYASTSTARFKNYRISPI